MEDLEQNLKVIHVYPIVFRVTEAFGADVVR